MRVVVSRRRRRTDVAALYGCVFALTLAAAYARGQPRSMAGTTSSAESSSAASALRTLRALVAAEPRSSTSVAVFEFRTNRLITAGAASGMTSASVVKVQLLESLLLERQRAGRTLSSYERSLVTRMIEHSDNNAADAVFDAIGGQRAVARYEPKLGLDTRVVHLGTHEQWGLTTTTANQEIVLLKNLVDATSPLSLRNRYYGVYLMRHVEAGQRWGVPVAADKGSHPALKNGWLSLSRDHGRWVVNSVGLITYHKRLLAIAVMTQHERSYSAGIRRVQSLVRAAARAVHG